MTIVERLAARDGQASTPDRVATAANTLVRLGAQWVEQALADNPDGPVQMTTVVSRTEINYDVVIGSPEDSMSARGARCIWSKTVVFGHTDRTVAGGTAFVQAARDQEAVAWAALEVMEHQRGLRP